MRGIKTTALFVAILAVAIFLPGCGPSGADGPGSADSSGSADSVGIEDAGAGGASDEESGAAQGSQESNQEGGAAQGSQESGMGAAPSENASGSAAGGSSEGNGSGGSAQEEEGAGAAASYPFFSMFKKGNYHMTAKMPETEAGAIGIDMFVKNGMMAMTMNAGGQTSRVIFRDDKAYLIDDAFKMILIQPMTKEEYLSNGAWDTSGMELIGSGTAEFAGSLLPYDEYANASDSRVQYFIRDNALAGLRSIKGNTISDTEILALDANIPADAFDLPDGYQQITET
ncbi:MAG: hypothetical protein FWG53_08575 [Clostridiales bacterium]|nr:hypothetical protein [Clostridiales bacterium]